MVFHTITQLPIEDKQITLIIACRIRAVAPYTRSALSRKKRKEKVVCAFFFIIFYLKRGRIVVSGMIGYTQLLTTADHFL